MIGALGDSQLDVVLFLCSPESNWMTGESLNVSGGFVV
jgi:NAD(P)-dependent dehydrogenase (short-subunit alcohol dehydrogenase family)